MITHYIVGSNHRVLRCSILFLTALLVGCSSDGKRPNVLLVLIDTLRADHLHCYGYDGKITDHLDSLASEGVRWSCCQAQSSWTLPSMTSIFTGVTERAHLAGTRGEHLYGIGRELSTLPDLFSEMDYATFGIFNAPVMDVEYGFTRGCQSYDVEGCRETVDAEVVVDRIFEWVDGDIEQPFFIVAHFFDPHWPYTAPDGPQDLANVSASSIRRRNANGRITVREMHDMMSCYDMEIRYCDRELGRLFAGLRQRGLDENTIIVVVADHGEEFLDHGMMFHGRQFFQETIHVPLIMSGPGIPEDSVVDDVVGQYDILPTLMHLTEGSVPDYVQGVSLLPTDGVGHEGVPSSGVNTGLKQRAAVRFGDAKVLWDADADSAWGYDLSQGFEDEDSRLAPDRTQVENVRTYWATVPVAIPDPVEVGDHKAKWFKDMAYI
ncbi:sulfatase-like hydrolase/transferase [Candidatus Fermentibacteria bacterium]|nr:sulfatase-like hydrolase/transferase [Candidatus Fermentibacteria bacterium]